MTQTDEARAREIAHDQMQRMSRKGCEPSKHASHWAECDFLTERIATALRQARREGAEQMRSEAAKLISGWETWDLFREEGAEVIRALPLPGDQT